ncbi:MAG TPA: methionine--tRNA ligase [Acidobacteriaceae bacterium]|jgi:methionyl-tRNA synthetase|nr:methionine--tRNA ligase [Acidobacteriaceae bacterium]
MSSKFYLTTPIYYVNARPHIGHTYTTVVADAIARRKRSLGVDTWFLTGTDEHGQKIERSARQANCTPQEFTDRVSAEFRGLWDRMGLTYDDYIRTTEPRHKKAVQNLFALLRERGYIYKGSYTGQYCVSDEAYVDVPPGAPCPDCGRITETVNEENYYFKLSAFERKLLEYYDQHPEFIGPETRRNEVIAFVKSGLRDLSVSRTSFDWGIPVPGDEKHVVYVWLDALANYITALGWSSPDDAKYQKFWPADLHLVGKEIIRFHCVYWPAFLLAAGLPLPKSVHAHGWLLFEESKMSKSRGNIVRTETILEGFGALKPDLPKAEQDLFAADALRYFLLREIAFGNDGGFSFDALVQRYNADLANGYGNLVSRTLSMIGRYFDGLVPMPATGGAAVPRAPSIRTEIPAVITAFATHFEALDFARALEAAWTMVASIDGFLTATAPWKKDDDVTEEQQQAYRSTVLYIAAESIRIITALVYPVIPYSAARVWAQLGLGDITKADLKNLQWGGLKPGTKLGELTPLFPRADKETITRMSELEQTNTPPPAEPAASDPKSGVQEPHISKLHSLVDGLAVAMAESTTETSVVVGLEKAIAETVRETVGVDREPAKTGAAASASTPHGLEDATKLPGAPPLPPAPATGTAAVAGSAALAHPPAAAPAPDGKITIDDFTKVELRVGQIKVAERVPKADKLLRLEVDLGTETRQILAGIAESYAPETLIGRKVVIVANLAPRKLRGLESNGMVVAASTEGGKAVLATFAEDVPNGTRLK